jgi:quercetin dioxygenase-like cupin family protein
VIDLNVLAREHMEKARTAKQGRSARVFLHDGPLRQTLIAMTTGSELAEHDAPPAASLHILQGRVRLVVGGKEQEFHAGQVCAVPHRRHGLHAVSDTVVLLTTVSQPTG